MRRDVVLKAWNEDPAWRIGLLTLIILVCFSAGCSTPGSTEEDGRIPVAVTLLPMKEIAEAVGGDRITVTVVVPPGSDPHTFEPSPGLITTISGSRIFFRVGENLIPFEDRLLSRLSSQNPDLMVVDLSEGIDLIPAGGGSDLHRQEGEEQEQNLSYDPHIWLSPRNGGLMAASIADALSRIDPGGESIYQENLDQYLRKIDLVDAEVREALSTRTSRRFIVTHDSWGYFAREYGLEQISVQIGGKEPTAREIQEIIRIAREEEIRSVCIEPQFQERSARVIAAEIEGDVIVIDPLPEAYLENFISVAYALGGI